MKLNKIFMALSAMAIVGCSSEDVMDFTANQAVEDSNLIELGSNFVLAGVGEEGDVTRTHWDQDPETKSLVNKFLPIYNSTAVSGMQLNQAVNLDEQAVGLCWLGNGAVGTDVYTNYQFFHFGWLKKGETEADLDNCGDFGTLYNGALYNEIRLADNGVDGKEAAESNFILPSSPINKTSWELNYNSGVYRTDNKSIFKGKYIVYYPFEKDFQEAGTIPAKAETSFNWDPTTVDGYKLPGLGKATFRYSAPVDIEGGDQAANFGMYNLSTLVRLRVFAPVGDPYLTNNIDKIVLYSESGKLLKQANLAADKIEAGKKGAELYAETEGTKTITTKFTSATSLNVKAETNVSAYITVLPTTVDDLVALVHNQSKNMWARVNLGNTVFEAGAAKVVDINVAASNFQSEFIAVDQASLVQALEEANKVASESDPQTITVIGDVKLESNLNINDTYDKGRFITIDGGSIIVPQNVTLTLDYLKEMKSDIVVLGKDCCNPGTGGRLDVNGTSTDAKDVITLNNITLKKTEARVSNDTEFENYNPLVTYQGKTKITINDDKKVNVEGGTVKVQRAVEHKGDIEIGVDGKVIVKGSPVAGSLNFLGSTVDNYGIIEVEKAGEFNMKNANGSSVWTDGQTMTNYPTGKFIHNVDAVVGTAVQYMKQNGEYRCRVDKQKALDDAYTQWIACNVIEMIETTADIHYNLGAACQHKKNGVDQYVDIEVNNGDGTYKTTFDDWDVAKDENKPSDGKEIKIGNLTVKSPLDIDYQMKNGSQRKLTVNGDMTVLANTQLLNSDKVTVTGNLNVNTPADAAPVTLKYYGEKKIANGLKVNGNITVTDAVFDASEKDAIKIECTNFSLVKKNPAGTGATATFGNRNSGNTNAQNMTVKGTINNGKGCTFTISPASGADLLAWITCYKTEGEGTFAGTPTVVKP